MYEEREMRRFHNYTLMTVGIMMEGIAGSERPSRRRRV
jgi:hypothetical protein